MPNQQHSNKIKKFINRQKQAKQQIKQTNRQTECLSTPPNINDTLSPMWQEIQYSGMRNQSVQRSRRPPELEHQNTYQKRTAIFLTSTNIKRLIAVRNEIK